MSTGAHPQGHEEGHTPGHPMTMGTAMLDAGSKLQQSFTPVKNIHEHLCGFHFYATDMSRQVCAHHYCSHINEDVWQCVIYDSDEAHARLIGIEYVIKEHIFEKLPDEEKKLWHTHEYEVKSGELIMPRLRPEAAETAVMRRLVNTYGKTWHFWQVDRGDTLPMGVPQLMMAPTQDGELNTKMVDERNESYGVYFPTRTEDKKAARASMPGYKKGPDDKADYWKHHGKGLELKVVETEFKTAKF